MKVNEMNICFSISADYVFQMITTMVSVLENNQDSDINFYVLSTGLSAKDKELVDKLTEYYPNFSVRYIDVDAMLFQNFNFTINYITVETYFRYIIADLLPDIDKILYLDADLSVNKNIGDLYNADIRDFYIGGVTDTYINELHHKADINLTSEDLYVNAGVLLFNLKKIRDEHMVKQLFFNQNKYDSIIKFQDQDIINLTFRGKIKELDDRYNVTTVDFDKKRARLKNAVIIHYTGALKPWNFSYTKPQRKIWRRYFRIANKLLDNEIAALFPLSRTKELLLSVGKIFYNKKTNSQNVTRIFVLGICVLKSETSISWDA